MRSFSILAAALAAVLCSPVQAVFAQSAQGKRPIDFFDRVEITFTATGIKAIGDAAKATSVPSDTAEGRLILFVPKVKDSAEGFWETQAVRFSSMSVKAGDYSFPMTRVSASMQFIDTRPMRLVIGRSPAGRDAVLPGRMDFALTLARASRSMNDYQLEFSAFAYTLFGQEDVEFVASEGTAKVVITKEGAQEKNPAVDYGFSIGSYSPDAQ